MHKIALYAEAELPGNYLAHSPRVHDTVDSAVLYSCATTKSIIDYSELHRNVNIPT